MIILSMFLAIGGLNSPTPHKSISFPAIMLRMEESSAGYSSVKEALIIKSNCGQARSHQTDCNKVHLVNDHPEKGQQVTPPSAER